jgi:hypothetical protein
MTAMLIDPTFAQLRTLNAVRELRAVVTADGRTAIGSADRYTHGDLRSGLGPKSAGRVLLSSTTSELMIFKTNDLMVIAPFSKRDYSRAERQLLDGLASACEVALG